MSSLELYEGLNMKGQSVSVNCDTPKLSHMGFRKRARSLRVIRHPWVVFTEDNYDGHFRIYEGDHFSIPSFENKISSARLMEEDLDNPELVIYEDTCYRGQTLRLTRPTESFETYGFEGKGLSEIAIKGIRLGLKPLLLFHAKKQINVLKDLLPSSVVNPRSAQLLLTAPSCSASDPIEKLQAGDIVCFNLSFLCFLL
uniref:Beta/gamma crystallin 'Greek key' domain-containing protein n=1 Tax=Leptobrachium leishanense TaxID=445787 RepID=A0A8C5P5Z9_9ANUR